MATKLPYFHPRVRRMRESTQLEQSKDYKQIINEARGKMIFAEGALEKCALSLPRNEEEYTRLLAEVLQARKDFISTLQGLSASLDESTRLIFGLTRFHRSRRSLVPRKG
jgi:hypothetical protein